MKNIVIDTNVIVSILIHSNEEIKLFTKDHSMLAPSLLKIELANVLRKYHTLQSVPLDKALSYYTAGLDIVTAFYSNEDVLDKAISISFKLNHPIYDCVYLALAMELDLPFVSSDKRLITKANALGIEGLIFDDIINNY